VNAALVVIGLTFAFALTLGVLAGRGKERTLEQWAVGGRGFGALFMFLLMAGEIYTTFTFLGGSGWAYGKGAPAFYIICYGSLAFVMSYWLLPPIWRYAKARRLFSQAEFFAAKYESEGLGVLVALVGVVAMVPYLVLQLKGLGIIVSEASYGSVSPAAAIWAGTIGLVAYVMVSGIHGSALTAIVKDILILVVVVGLGLWLPWRLHGGIGPMFNAIEGAHPDLLRLPQRGLSATWFSSTVLLTALGFYMWPHTFASVFSAKHASALRRNATFMPLYQLVLLFVFFIGFAALLAVPGLEGTDADLALLRVVKETLPPWAVGLVGAAGVLTALVPGSMILMAAATVLANTVYRRASGDVDAPRIARIARGFVPVVAAVALWFTFRGGSTLVALLLMGYAFVTQLFPALLLSLGSRVRVHPGPVAAGILVGVGIVSWTTLTEANIAALLPWLPSALADANIGIIAMLGNLLAMGLLHLVWRRTERLAPTA
jgi:SSS family solute:Na+ symporter